MTAPISGNTGKVYVDAAEVADVNGFSFGRAAEMHPYVSSSTSGQQKQVVGNKSWTGGFTMMSPDGSLDPGFDEGDEITFKGETTTGKYVEATAKVASISNETDIAGGGPDILTIELACHGAPTVTG